jgi:hypothetical protein
MGVFVIRLLLQGTCIPLKWPVAPVSAMVLLVGGEGPRVGGGSTVLRLTMLLLLSLGVPLYQVADVGLFWLLLFGPNGVRLFLLDGRGMGREMFRDPCCMLLRVASLICPSAWTLHAALLWVLFRPCVQQYFQFRNSSVVAALVVLVVTIGGAVLAVYPALVIVGLLRRFLLAWLKCCLSLIHVWSASVMLRHALRSSMKSPVASMLVTADMIAAFSVIASCAVA